MAREPGPVHRELPLNPGEHALREDLRRKPAHKPPLAVLAPASSPAGARVRPRPGRQDFATAPRGERPPVSFQVRDSSTEEANRSALEIARGRRTTWKGTHRTSRWTWRQ